MARRSCSYSCVVSGFPVSGSRNRSILLVYHQLGMAKQCHLGSRQQTIYFIWCSCADRARRLAEAGADGFCGGVPTRPPRWFTGPVSAEKGQRNNGGAGELAKPLRG